MLSTEKKQSFTEKGYFIAEDIIPKTLIEEMRREAELLAAAEEPNDKLIVEKVVCGDVWYQEPKILDYSSLTNIAQLPAALDLVRGILNSSSCKLVFWALLRISPGEGGTGWHQDVGISTESKVVLTFYLHETDNVEGQIRVVPGSHISESSEFDKNQSRQDEVRLSISNETVIFHPKELWHTGSANTSKINNWLLFLHYGVAE
jgi:ectoine hydroxylase-related dioxygenase (phytanoyl-CoA dioxygenase family)